MKRRGTLLLALTAFAFDVAACSCARVSVEDQLDAAQTIALVRIRQVELNAAWKDELATGVGDARPLRAEVEVLEMLRGAPSDTLRVLSGYGNGDCGLPMVPGHDVLLVGEEHEGEFELHFCSASRELGVGSLLEAAGRPAPRSLDRLYVEAVRGYLTRGTPIHECLRGGVPPPPPPPDADPADAGPNCWELLSPRPAEAVR